MEQSPWNRVWRLYAAVMGVLTLLAGALMIRQVVGIYQAGISPDNISAGVYIQPIYSREIVARYFSRIAVPVYVCLAWAALGLILWLAHPAESSRTRAVAEPEETLHRLRARLKEAALQERPEIKAAVERERRLRRGAMLASGAAAVVCAAVSANYLLRVENFTSWDLESVMGGMLQAVVPWVALAFAAVCAASEACHRSANREIGLLKQAPMGKRPPKEPEKPRRWLPAARIILYAAAIALVVLGVLNGGMRDVLIKAINICTECIGLG